VTEPGEITLLRQLADRQTITDLIYRYCRAVDRIDPELGKSVFHPDSTADYGTFFKGNGHDMIDAVCESHRHCIVHSHQVTNITITLDGDRAGSEAYHIAAIRMMAGDSIRQVTVWGRYIDAWSRRDGRWGCDRRLVAYDLDEVRDVTPMMTEPPPARDRTCPSYALLGVTQ